MKEHRGGCLCGLVRYRTDGAPLWVAHCHCHSCRRHTGSAIATFVGFKREQVEFLSQHRSTYPSSPGVLRSFCARCGTPISYEADACPGELHLYVGTFDDPETFTPQSHVFYAEHLPWFETRDALPRFPGSGNAGASS